MHTHYLYTLTNIIFTIIFYFIKFNAPEKGIILKLNKFCFQVMSATEKRKNEIKNKIKSSIQIRESYIYVLQPYLKINRL